jgi:hypothetical protein
MVLAIETVFTVHGKMLVEFSVIPVIRVLHMKVFPKLIHVKTKLRITILILNTNNTSVYKQC